MDKLKTGGKKTWALDSTVSQSQRQDILLRLQQAKKSGKVYKNALYSSVIRVDRLIVSIDTEAVQRGKARMLTKVELESLKISKKIIADRAQQIIRKRAL